MQPYTSCVNQAVVDNSQLLDNIMHCNEISDATPSTCQFPIRKCTRTAYICLTTKPSVKTSIEIHLQGSSIRQCSNSLYFGFSIKNQTNLAYTLCIATKTYLASCSIWLFSCNRWNTYSRTRWQQSHCHNLHLEVTNSEVCNEPLCA